VNLPRITIVTPSFNQAKYLSETIESVLKQDYPNLEYIIIDGGSTDGSVDVIKRYEHHLAYWVSEKDRGQSHAINKGLDRATGDLFNWINSDDILFPGALQRIAAAFICNPEADLIVGDNARSDKDGAIVRISAAPSRLTASPRGWLVWVAQQSTFVSLLTLRRVGRIREDLHCMMDAELYYRILAGGGRFVLAKGIVGMIREHPEAKGSVRVMEWDIEREKIFEEYGIPQFSRTTVHAKTFLLRLLDGSYLRSYRLTKKLASMKAWKR